MPLLSSFHPLSLSLSAVELSKVMGASNSDDSATITGLFDSFLQSFNDRHPLTPDCILKECIPTLGAYYLMAVLVIQPNTRAFRAMLTPVAAGLLGNALMHWDVFPGDPRTHYMNNLVMFTMVLMFMNSVVWGLKRTQLKRIDGPQETLSDVLLNATDLVWNPTAVGWAHGVPNPNNSRSRIPRGAFLLSRLYSFVIHFLIMDFCQWGTLVVGQSALDTPDGSSIFNPNLPTLLRFINGSCVSLLLAVCVYCGITVPADLVAIIGVGIFRSPPERWPPVFNRPWACASLTQLWGRGWHQQTRLPLSGFGGRPLALLTGSNRFALIIGTFAASAIGHEVAALSLGKGPDPYIRVTFIMAGVGVMLEATWKRVMGSKVGGVAGFLWTWTWMCIWGNFLMDAWCRRGMVHMRYMPDEQRPAYFVWHKILGLPFPFQ